MISAIKVLLSASFAILLSIQSPVAEAPMNIVVRQLEGKRWHVRFASADPVSRLYFVSHALDEASARAIYWEPVDPSIEILRESGTEYIQRKDGVDFDVAEFTVATRFTRSIGSQPSFIPFSDGGVLIHDPSFIVWPERPETIIGKNVHIVSSFYRLDGFERLSGEGERFSYIGMHKPEALAGHHVLYDTGLSPHLKMRFDDMLPKVIEYFAARLNSNHDDLVFSISQHDESLEGRSGASFRIRYSSISMAMSGGTKKTWMGNGCQCSLPTKWLMFFRIITSLGWAKAGLLKDPQMPWPC